MTTPTAPRRILIVDDEPSIARALQVLMAQAGYTTQHAASGTAAITLLDTEAFDLVLLDVMLPGVDGFGVCYHVRKQQRYTPIVMLTARDQLTDKLVGIELGADAYLTKPFHPQELVAQVRAVLRLSDSQRQMHASATGARASALVHGPIELWDAEHRVVVRGAPVDLAPKEFELLRLLMREPGRVHGRETLLRTVWGYESSIDTRTVDTHVQRLRSKIELDPAAPVLIVTVRGYGYRLAAEPPRP
jgi:two-component system alkaline phosphatase synthesis response regulator PhoP